MRSRWLRATAADVVEIAQEIAIAGLGRRGIDARNAMARAKTAALRRREEERWQAIARGARRSRFAPAQSDEQGFQMRVRQEVGDDE